MVRGKRWMRGRGKSKARKQESDPGVRSRKGRKGLIQG